MHKRGALIGCWRMSVSVRGLVGACLCVFLVSLDFSSWLSRLVGVFLMRAQTRIYFCSFPNPERNAHRFPPICESKGGGGTRLVVVLRDTGEVPAHDAASCPICSVARDETGRCFLLARGTKPLPPSAIPATGVQPNEREPPSPVISLLRGQTPSNGLALTYYIKLVRCFRCAPVCILLSKVLSVLSDEELRAAVASRR